MNRITAKDIDDILPQTQCGLCGFKGCMPYAEALAKKAAAINLCPPGGVEGLFAIAKKVDEDPIPFVAEMEQKTKPPMHAIIREAECIGCTKCIQACPVDAILGSGKWMHTVIAEECTGCELCIAPCPVDCIEMVTLAKPTEPDRNHFRNRYQARNLRLQRERDKQEAVRVVKERKAYIMAAVLRTKEKRK